MVVIVVVVVVVVVVNVGADGDANNVNDCWRCQQWVPALAVTHCFLSQP